MPGAKLVAYVEREAFAFAFAFALLVAAMRQGALAAAPLWSDARTFPGRLCMLGNEVVPLQAAYALRALGAALVRRAGGEAGRFVWGL